MKKEDATNKNQTDEYPYKATLATGSFERLFALYCSRVHEYVHSLFPGDYSSDREETIPNTY